MRKQGKRGKYKAGPTALYRTLAGHIPFTEEEVIKHSAPIRMSLQRFTIGTADETDWNTMVHVANVVTLRGEKIAKEVLECGRDAQKAALSIYERYKKTLKWGVNHEDLSRLVDAIDLHEQMLRLSLPRLMIEAMEETHRRVAAGKVVVLLDDELVIKKGKEDEHAKG